MTGRIVICPTPIGNLGDITLRTLEVLREADLIYAEDTRVAKKLLSCLGIEGKALERLDENVIAQRADEVLVKVSEGLLVAYVTDAGMPGVSDPGLRLVRAACDAGVDVDVLPGPSAAATAYVASGMTCPNFYFGGFFPRKESARREALRSLASLDAALIFYESPNRLVSALETIAEELPLRDVAVCRELTKVHQEVVRGSAPQVSAEFAGRETVKGEIALVIDAPNEVEVRAAAEGSASLAQTRAIELIQAGERPKDVARLLVEEFGISRNDAYNMALEARG